MAESAVIIALVAGAVAVAGVMQERVLTLPPALVYLPLFLYILCTFRLSFPQASPVRFLVTCYFLSFSSGFLTTLLTGQPLSPHLPTLSAEYLSLYAAFLLLRREQIEAFFRKDAVRGVLFLGVAFVKSNALVRTVYDGLAQDFSLAALLFALGVGVVQVLSGPLVYSVDLLVASRLEQFNSASLKKFLRVGVLLTSVELAAIYYALFLVDAETSKTHGKSLAYTAAHVAFFVFYGSEAIAYSQHFRRKVE